MISSTDEFQNLDKLYHQRNLNKETLEQALSLIVRFHQTYYNVEFSKLPAQELRALSVTCEALDYFNRLDKFIGREKGYAKAIIYDWLLDNASELWSLIPYKTKGSLATQDPYLLLCRIRLLAAVSINEQYRLQDYSYGPDSEMGQLISFAEQHLAPQVEGNFQLVTAYMDIMTNLHFLHGKIARQAGGYSEAEISFYKSSSYLLRLALKYSVAQDGELQDSDDPNEKIRSKVRRVGIVDLARAWLYLAWGKIEKADLYVERAIQLLGPGDALIRMLAESIQGVVLRIKSAYNPEDLNKAIKLLSKSYSSFFSDDNKSIKMPRHSIRTLYELEVALIYNDQLGDALSNIEKVVNQVYKDDYSKMVNDFRWRSQMYVLCSRIARRDKNNELEKRLRALFIQLAGINKLQIQASVAKRVENYRSSGLAIEFAKTARDIAREHNIRLGEMDSLIALGKAYFNSNDINSATKTFNNCLNLVRAPHGQSTDKGIDGSVFSAISHLYLARIAVRNGNQELAKREFEMYELLPAVEHSWILKLAEEIRAEFEQLSERMIIIRFDEKITWEELKEKMEYEAIKKMIIQPRERGVRSKDLMEKLDLIKSTFHNLRRKVENEDKPESANREADEE